jgi:pectinesterase
MLELSVNTRSPAAITAAFKKIREMVKSGAVSNTTPVHLTLEPGIYTEIISYNLSNPLIMESVPGTKAEECVVQAENCEAFHKGPENRAVFALGSNTTNISLRNFTVLNTHVKSILEGNTDADAAEAFCWNNRNGTLFAEGMHFEGRQNTLCVRGFSWFKNCSVSGDVDFIWGDCNTSLFEDCDIYIREDNRGDFNGYAIKSMAIAQKTGFVFTDCRFTGEKRKKAKLYVARTSGKGGAISNDSWDSIALIHCMVSSVYDPEFGWDDDHSLLVYPRGNPKNGWREYGTRTVTKGKVGEADTSLRNIKSYVMTEDEYFAGYASRYLILHDTPFGKTEN